MALLRPSDAPRELHGRRKLDVFSPATLERLGEVEMATPDDVRRAVARAREAQVGWAERSFEERGRFLLRARDLLVERADEIAETICRDTGKPRMEAVATEVLAGCDALTYYAKRAAKLLRDQRQGLHLLKTKKLVLSWRPMGVVGIITPWNFPFVLSLNPTVQALMAGNAVVLKPSEITPFVGEALAKLFADAGLPEGVFQMVTGDGATGAALVDAGCDKISFTGSVRTGRKIARGVRARADPVHARARRQGPDDRLRRRRPRARGARRGLGRVRERGPDLHVDRARVRGPARGRAVHRAGRRADQGAAPGARDRRRGRRRRDHQPGAARGDRAPRARTRSRRARAC